MSSSRSSRGGHNHNHNHSHGHSHSHGSSYGVDGKSRPKGPSRNDSYSSSSSSAPSPSSAANTPAQNPFPHQMLPRPSINEKDMKDSHPLQTPWKIYYEYPQYGLSPEQWREGLKPCGVVRTVEAFWRLSTNLPPIVKLNNGTNYYLFRETIFPEWESEDNKKGGKWTLVISGRLRTPITELWEKCMMTCIGEVFEESHMICGCILSLRSSGNRIMFWTKDASDEQSNMKIGKQIQEILELPATESLKYTSHQKQGETELFSYSIN